jgi:Lrp/AsnC family leucine-responsive transcriptional regulator
VGLTTPAVAERVYRLEKLGVIRGFHADISLERLGMPILIFVRLSMAGPESLVRTFQAQVKKWQEVLECHRVTGSDSFIVKARVVSVEHLERLLDKLGHYGSTSTATVLSSPVEQRVMTEKVIDECRWPSWSGARRSTGRAAGRRRCGGAAASRAGGDCGDQEGVAF